MSDLSDSRPHGTLDQLDFVPRDLPREHGQVINLATFPRTEHSSRPHSAPQSKHAADERTADAETELQHALNLAFADLGGAAFALAHHGALDDNRLAAHVQRIHQLYTQLDALVHTTAPVSPAAPAHLPNTPPPPEKDAGHPFTAAQPPRLVRRRIRTAHTNQAHPAMKG